MFHSVYIVPTIPRYSFSKEFEEKFTQEFYSYI